MWILTFCSVCHACIIERISKLEMTSGNAICAECKEKEKMMTNGNDLKLCATCHERPREKGQSYCREDRKIFQKRYYDQMRASERVLTRVRHRQELVERLEAQPITIAYWSEKGIIHGFCKRTLAPVGAKETGFGTEFQLFCATCYETIFLSEHSRLREWSEVADDDTSHSGTLRSVDIWLRGAIAV